MNNKDVIYIDVEDEITSIIDKVSTSEQKVVALVLPKRATAFHSVVNMKLLNKKAKDAKKSVILVTSEASLLPLAGVVGLYVAKSLQSKPAIPPNPNLNDDGSPLNLDDEPETIEQSGEENIDPQKPIGELAGIAAVGALAAKKNEPEENIDFDNDAITDPMGLDEIDKSTEPKKLKKDKKPKGIDGKSTKVPDFNKFRRNLLIGLASLVVLIVLWYVGFKVMPKAKITVQTNTSSINTNITATLSQANQNLDLTNNTVPSKTQTVTKNSTSTAVNTTGTKIIGTSATGTVTVTNNGVDPASYTIPAGTVFTDPTGNYNYSSISAAEINGFTGHGHFNSPSVNIPVTATQVGPTYNITATNSYTSNYSNISGYSISGSTMKGGSSQTVQVVSQADIDAAKSQFPVPNNSQIEQQLSTGLSGMGYMPITATYIAGTPTFTPNEALGVQANSVTVTENINYTMFGAKQNDLDTLVRTSVNQQINPSTQSILDTGTSRSKFKVISSDTASSKVTMQTATTVGPKLNASDIVKQSAGQKSADIKSTISQTPGVTNVIVKYSPFWVTSTPSNVNKITVVIQKSDGSPT